MRQGRDSPPSIGFVYARCQARHPRLTDLSAISSVRFLEISSERFERAFLHIELLGVRSEIELKGPRGAILIGEMPVGIRDAAGVEKRFITWLACRSACWGDQSIDDDMCHMHAARP
jgi:hypothetical protein